MIGAFSTWLISALGVIINAVAVVVLIYQVNKAKAVYIQEQRLHQKQSTLDFISATLEIRTGFLKEIPSPNDRDKTKRFIASLPRNPTARASLYAFLNYWEYVAAGVNEEILDIGVVDKTVGTSAMRAYDAYSAYIEEMRNETAHPDMYDQLEILANKLRELRPGKPITV